MFVTSQKLLDEAHRLIEDRRMLFSQRKFHAYYWAQFLGAFADNLFKTALIALLTFRGVEVFKLSGEPLAAFAGGIFILPFFLVSGSSGVLADRVSKSSLIQQVKLLEVFIMAAAGLSFLKGWDGALLGLLFLMGVQSALFGPVKYSVIPDLVGSSRILAANTAVEMGTFLSILLGTLIGGYLSQTHIQPQVLAGFLFFPSLLGWLSSLGLPKLPAPQGTTKPLPLKTWLASNLRVVKLAFRTEGVPQVLLRISWFWFLGAGLIVLMPSMTTQYLGAQESVFTALLALFCGGIALGAVFTYLLARKKGFRWSLRVGTWGMSLALGLMALALSQWDHHPLRPWSFSELLGFTWPVALFIGLFALAFFASFFVVPLYTVLVGSTPTEIRSQLIGANNVLNSFFMVISSVVIIVVFGWGLKMHHLLAAYAVAGLAALWDLREQPLSPTSSPKP